MTEATPAPDDPVPAADGFRMPAEWLPHRATWLAWPHNRQTWPHNLGEAQQEFVRLAATIARGETVCVLASGPALDQARRMLEGIRDLELFDVPTNDAWIRDTGPTFVTRPDRGELAAVAWRYNGWGEKYPPFDLDQQVGQRVAGLAGCPCLASQRVVEGGALEINAQGDLLTTISCLLHFNRNPVPGAGSADTEITGEDFHRLQSALSADLAALLGLRSIAWLSGAELEGDDTDGHIDQQVRFVNDHQVLLARGASADDPRDESLRRNIGELQATFAESPVPLQGMDLPLPPPIRWRDTILPASYLNFYICNYGVIVPQFDNTLADARAIDIVKTAFPGRRIIGLPALNLAVGLGSFHCLTQQEPDPSVGPAEASLPD